MPRLAVAGGVVPHFRPALPPASHLSIWPHLLPEASLQPFFAPWGDCPFNQGILSCLGLELLLRPRLLGLPLCLTPRRNSQQGSSCDASSALACNLLALFYTCKFKCWEYCARGLEEFGRIAVQICAIQSKTAQHAAGVLRCFYREKMVERRRIELPTFALRKGRSSVCA